jgi:hypothetical protein
MKASFPVEFVGNILGKSREAGEFPTNDGVVSYGEAFDITFDSSEGLTQTCRVSLKQLDEAADFDVSKAPRFAAIRVLGDVNVRPDGASFRPTKVTLAK